MCIRLYQNMIYHEHTKSTSIKTPRAKNTSTVAFTHIQKQPSEVTYQQVNRCCSNKPRYLFMKLSLFFWNQFMRSLKLKQHYLNGTMCQLLAPQHFALFIFVVFVSALKKKEEKNCFKAVLSKLNVPFPAHPGKDGSHFNKQGLATACYLALLEGLFRSPQTPFTILSVPLVDLPVNQAGNCNRHLINPEYSEPVKKTGC